MIKGKACKIVDMSTSKTGKHDLQKRNPRQDRCRGGRPRLCPFRYWQGIHHVRQEHDQDFISIEKLLPHRKSALSLTLEALGCLQASNLARLHACKTLQTPQIRS